MGQYWIVLLLQLQVHALGNLAASRTNFVSFCGFAYLSIYYEQASRYVGSHRCLAVVAFAWSLSTVLSLCNALFYYSMPSSFSFCPLAGIIWLIESSMVDCVNWPYYGFKLEWKITRIFFLLRIRTVCKEVVRFQITFYSFWCRVFCVYILKAV